MQFLLFLLPISALVRRELLTALRRKRAFAVLLFTVACVFFFTFIAIFNSAQYNGYSSQSAIRTVFMILTVILFLAAGLFPMVIGAVSICVERQQESWDLLSTSLLRPIHIILAKWFNAVGFFLLLFIAIFPLIGVLFFFVGIDWIAFTRSILVILCTACVSAAIGICTSVFMKRPVQAIVVSFLIVCFFVGVVNIAIVFLLDTLDVNSVQGFLEKTVQIWSPLGALLISWESMGGPDRYFWGIVYQFVWLLLCLCIAWVGLLRIRFTFAFEVTKLLFPNFIKGLRSLISRKQSHPLIPDNANPMYAKEIRAGLLSQPKILWLTYFCATLLILCINFFQFDISSINLGNDERWFYELTFLSAYWQGVLILVLVPALAASIFVRDQELHNEDLLQGTLLRPVEIVFGKTKAIIKVMLPWLGALATGIALYIFMLCSWSQLYSSYAPLHFFFFCISYAVCFFYILSLSFACAVFCRRTVTAVVSAYVVNISLLGLLSLFIVFMWEANLIPDNREEVLYTWISPLMAPIYNALEHGYDSTPFNFYWFSHIIFFGLVSLLIYFLATVYFSKMRWRDR